MWVRHCIPRGFAVPLSGLARAKLYRWGSAGFFYGNGGMPSTGAWRLLMDQVDLMDQMDKMGASRYTPWVCCAAVWFGSGEELPQGLEGNLMTAGVCSLRGRDA